MKIQVFRRAFLSCTGTSWDRSGGRRPAPAGKKRPDTGKGSRKCSSPLSFGFFRNYSSTIEPVGHVAAQVPQPRHASASISYLSSPSVIAPTGHSPAQAPHFTQPSLITNAIELSSCLELMRATVCTHCVQCTSSRRGMQVNFFYYFAKSYLDSSRVLISSRSMSTSMPCTM